MQDEISSLLKKNNYLYHLNQGITVLSAKNASDATKKTDELLTFVVDRKTVLFLSGGKTPKDLYTSLATADTFFPGAVGLVDERYGKKLHNKSNEKMIQGTGLLRVLQLKNVPFYPILKAGVDRENTALQYDQELRSLFAVYPKSVGFLGIGADGHTAGIPIYMSKVKSQKSKVDSEFSLVTEYDDKGGSYGERVTMTFLGLSMLDLLVVLVVGEEKKKALELMFNPPAGGGTEGEIPARFFKRPEIAAKAIIITDQQI